MKRIFFFTVILSALAYLLCFPQEAFLASASGLKLWFYTVLPSLLPFLILSDFLIHTGKIPHFLGHFRKFFARFFGLTPYGAYAFFLGLFCGYPMGAKLTADLLREKRIEIQEARYLLTFANNASPMFISSYILLNSLKIKGYTVPTFVILYLSTFFTSIIFRVAYRRFFVSAACSNEKETSLKSSFGRLIDVSIMNGFETITRLGGYIILFSIGASMITRITLPAPALSWVLPGIVEITTGIHQTAGSPLDFPVKYLLILAFTSFGGLSTLAQTRGMLQGTPLSIPVYLAGKLVNTGCTLALGILFLIIQSII